MNPFSLELTAAHRKFEFERAVKAAQTAGHFRREAAAAKERIAAAEQPASPETHGVVLTFLVLLRKLIPARVHRTTAGTHT